MESILVFKLADMFGVAAQTDASLIADCEMLPVCGVVNFVSSNSLALIYSLAGRGPD
jgi:hypothetical protein